ncbi:MAG: hypothetical protein H6925_00320 [Holosporaceae bacterium]|nr:MAG: hypothetical protein H6925_00320 [Holosporaceae bacterium]
MIFNIKRVGDDGHEQTVGVLYVHYIPHPDRQYYKVEGPIAYCKDGDW